MLIKNTNGNPENYTIGQLRRDNPNVSFPKDVSAEILEQYGVYTVKQTTAPQLDSLTYRHAQSVELIGAEWVQVWQVVKLPQPQAEENIRAKRDSLLQDTDWIVSKAYERNEPVPDAWAAYRQALRDITTQAGFPYDTVFPEYVEAD